MAVEVRRFRADEWEAVRDTRLRALADAPRRLVETVLAHARSAGDAEVYLGVHFDNDDARRLCERCGFVDTGAGVDERELRRAL